jgi:hypothetical protein
MTRRDRFSKLELPLGFGRDCKSFSSKSIKSFASRSRKVRLSPPASLPTLIHTLAFALAFRLITSRDTERREKSHFPISKARRAGCKKDDK